MSINEDLIVLLWRKKLTARERAALKLALAILGDVPRLTSMEEFGLLPTKIELLNGNLLLTCYRPEGDLMSGNHERDMGGHGR
jgi:hypothetical protein